MRLIKKAVPEDLGIENDKENQIGNQNKTPRAGNPDGHSSKGQPVSRKVLFRLIYF